ncbi:MAG: 16S rRNA (cytosine(1402)-N(4))-methyltransferase RsmH [Bacteroidales bacterium]|nr:16S rRNA (cytosine(1402)-N(4))-methyltransferase RsmH [Bacteroidales bacterium]
MSEYHTPVLLDESVSALIADNPKGTYVDATFGGGGHSREILSRLTPEGRLIAFDRDSDALANAPDDKRLTLIHNNFRFVHNFVLEQFHEARKADATATVEDCAGRSSQADDNVEARKAGKQDHYGFGVEAGADDEFMAAAKIEGGEGFDVEAGLEAGVDGILADLGVSSHQFDTAERGFSFRYDAPLDMRMNVKARLTAAEVVNSYDEKELERVLRIYGEVDGAGRMARLICKARTAKAIETTGELDAAIAPCLPKFGEHKILAKVYQAFRIEVNQEMKSLEKFLDGAARSLKPGGRLAVITYHSLEDRMVKNFIKCGNVDGRMEKDLYGNMSTPLEALNRKPILPSEDEIASNTRARSAKLRVAVKKDCSGRSRSGSGGEKADRWGKGQEEE